MNGKKLVIKGLKLETSWNKFYKEKNKLVDKVFKNNFNKALKI